MKPFHSLPIDFHTIDRIDINIICSHTRLYCKFLRRNHIAFPESIRMLFRAEREIDQFHLCDFHISRKHHFKLAR